MIINTGQRTDIPAFYSQWFLNRLREAYVLVRANMRAHDPQSPLLIGHLLPGDVVHEPRQESWRDEQIRMEL